MCIRARSIIFKTTRSSAMAEEMRDALSVDVLLTAVQLYEKFYLKKLTKDK